VGRHRAQRAIERTGRGTGGSGYNNVHRVFPGLRHAHSPIKDFYQGGIA
jgi:hypothetical protein